MDKPVLAVDFDDVVAGFHQAFASYHNTYHGTSVTYDDIYSYDMSLIYGIDDQAMHDRVFDFCHHHHDTIVPIPGAIMHLKQLSRRYILVIVTSRCESIAEITNGWNRGHAPDIFADAHYTNGFASKFPERKRSKLEVCQQIGAVALIDDALSHANEVATGAGIPVFLPNRPWNQEKVAGGVIRVDGWDEITEQLLV